MPKIGQPITKAAKVAYVKGQGQTRDHHCHWPSCGKQVPPAKWGCFEHWMRLPKHLRDAIWDAYKPGQEVSMTPSKQYLIVADKVETWILMNYKCIACDGTGVSSKGYECFPCEGTGIER